MKKIIVLCLSGIFLFAANFEMEHNFHAALKKASKQKKEVMMIYSAPWCPECNYMKQVAFKDPKLSSYIKKHFVLLDFDIQKDNLPKGFSYKGIPVFFIVNKNGKEIGKLIGASKAGKFLKRLKNVQ